MCHKADDSTYAIEIHMATIFQTDAAQQTQEQCLEAFIAACEAQRLPGIILCTGVAPVAGIGHISPLHRIIVDLVQLLSHYRRAKNLFRTLP